MIVRLTYFSERDRGCTDAVVAKIVADAAEMNRRRDISGLLVADRHIFVQTLEGRREAVSSILCRIATDPRHRNLVVAACVEIDRRLYPDWGMMQIDDGSAVTGAWRAVGLESIREPWTLSAAALDRFLLAAAASMDIELVDA